MQAEEVKALIVAGLPDCEVQVATADGSHFDITVIGEVFAGMTPVKKQQAVYATINDRITSGEMHAVNIKTFTPAEWQTAQKLQVS